MNAPEIMRYRSAHVFLKDYYNYRKQLGKAFSFGSWSREIKYSHRSNLRLIIAGKRALSPTLEKCFKENLFKTAKDRKYFSILCEISREKSALAKENLEKKALALTKQKEVRLPHKAALHEDLLDSLGLIMLLGFEDVDHSLKGLAKILGKEESHLQQMLTKLEQNNLVEVRRNLNGDSEWFAHSKYTIFDDDMGNEKLAAYHRQSFNRAIAAQSLPQKVRRFDSLMLPLSTQDYLRFCEDLKHFMDEQFYKYNSDILKDKDIYQLQLGLFPTLTLKR